MGIVLGSLAKAIADRSEDKRSFWGRSYCEACKHKLAWYDLFPVFSYLWLKGKCRYCQAKIPLSNLLTELVLGLLVAVLFKLSFPTDEAFIKLFNFADWGNFVLLADFLFKIFIVVVVTIVFWTDFRTGLIFDRIIYPSTIVTVVYLLGANTLRVVYTFEGLSSSNMPFAKYLLPPYNSYLYDYAQRLFLPLFWNAVAGLAIAGVFILLIIVTRGRGMGWGDVKYVFLLGLVLGFPNIGVAVFLAFFVGAIYSLALVALRQRNFGQTIPFGPFLSLGALVALFWGNQILNWYYTHFMFVF